MPGCFGVCDNHHKVFLTCIRNKNIECKSLSITLEIDKEFAMPHIAARPSKNDKSGAVKYMQVSELMGDDREIIIIHQGDEYHLRLTSNNKLILTK